MPYSKLSELPPAVKECPKHAQEIFMAAFNAAFDQYKGDESKAFATAWAAVETKYHKDKDGKWIANKSEEIQEERNEEDKKDEPEYEVKEIIKTGMQYRTMKLDPETNVNVEKRTVKLSFSSEEPVERCDGMEILDHSVASVKLGRIKTGGPLLLNHNTDDQIGKIEEAFISNSRKGIAIVRFGKSPHADEIFQDVVDGIRENVSVGYGILEKRFVSDGKSEQKTYRAVWEPMEISIVSVPADINVGVGRKNPEQFETRILIPKPVPEVKEEQEQKIEPLPKEVKKEIPKMEKDLATIQKEERERVSAILSIGRQFKADELTEGAIAEGKTVDEFRAMVLEKMGKIKPVDVTPEIGLNEKEIKNFSFKRAILSIADRKWEKGCFEKECSDAVRNHLKLPEPAGFYVPFEVQAKRDFDYSTGAGGGYGNYAVATNLLAGSFIEMLYNSLLIRKLNATILGGLVGNVAIPKHVSGPTCYWITEGNAPTEGLPILGQLTFAPKTVGAYVDFTRQLLIQASIDVESFVRGAIAGNLAVGIDTACFKGGGSGEPVGLMSGSITGIGTVAGATVPTWANVLELEADVEVANALMGSLSYVCTPEQKSVFKQTVRHATNPVGFIWTDDNTMNGYPAYATNCVPKNLSEGGESDLHGLIFGNWADFVLAMWGVLDILVDPFSLSTSGGIRVVGLQSVDVGVRHAASFSFMKADQS